MLNQRNENLAQEGRLKAFIFDFLNEMEMVLLQCKFLKMEEHKESTKDETCLPMVSLRGWDEMMQSCSIIIKQRRRDYDQHTRVVPI